MEKLVIAVLFLCFMSAGYAHAQPDIAKEPSCKYCGMDRKQFSHSRMVIEYGDGASVGVCSLRCAAVELAVNLDREGKALLVADYGTRELVDAEKAFWVSGGSKPGVMTQIAKWAFAKKDDAGTFIAANGGTLVDFDAALKAAYNDMYQDTKMIREKRKMKKQKTMEHMHEHK